MCRSLILFPLILLLAGIAHPAKVHVVTEEYPPYNYTDSSGKITGMSTEVVELVMHEAGVSYSGITSASWPRIYDIALTQPNVLIYSIGRNAERESRFKWVGIIAPYNVYFFKLRENVSLEISSLKEAKGRRIGAVRDDVRTQYLKEQGFSDADLDLVARDSMNMKKLFSGRIDLLPIDEIAALFLAGQQGFDFSKMEKTLYLKDLSSGLYMAFSIGTPDETVLKCRAALEKIRKDGRLDRIRNKYLGVFFRK